jgi:hypothetical protein
MSGKVARLPPNLPLGTQPAHASSPRQAAAQGLGGKEPSRRSRQPASYRACRRASQGWLAASPLRATTPAGQLGITHGHKPDGRSVSAVFPVPEEDRSSAAAHREDHV